MRDVWEATETIVKKKCIPISVVWELTRRCNLNCIHCYNVKDNVSLSLDKIKKVAYSLREAGTLFLTLTGGEIFVRRDIVDILCFLKQLGFDIKIITNATLINKSLIKELKNIFPSEIGVSLYGVSSYIHDRITQVKGSFNKTVQAIKSLRSEGLNVHIKCTLMRDNFKEYKRIIQFARQLGVHYIIDPIISPKDDGSKEVFSHRLTEEQLKEFYWEEFEKIEEFNTTQPCDAGFNFGAISADGYIYPCIQFPLKVGDATRDNFKDVWSNSYVLNRLREAVKAGKTDCKRCNLYSYCSRCMGLSFLETGSPFSSYSTACIIARIYKEFIDSYGKK